MGIAVYSLLCNVMSCIVILCACVHSFMYSIKDLCLYRLSEDAE